HDAGRVRRPGEVIHVQVGIARELHGARRRVVRQRLAYIHQEELVLVVLLLVDLEVGVLVLAVLRGLGLGRIGDEGDAGGILRPCPSLDFAFGLGELPGLAAFRRDDPDLPGGGLAIGLGVGLGVVLLRGVAGLGV